MALVWRPDCSSVLEMSEDESSPAPRSGSIGLELLASGLFRTVAAIAAVITASRFYSYLLRSGVLDSQPAPTLGEMGTLLFAGPAILSAIVKLAVSMLILGSFGWCLAVLVSWAAAGLRRDQDA
jgi:hypothetical protein